MRAVRHGTHSGIRQYWASRKQERADYQRDYHLRRTYGIDGGMYDQMLADQGGSCAICRQPQQSQRQRLAVDHCHKTGAVRALLCTSCNAAIGALRDDIDLILAAAAYVENHAAAARHKT